MKYTWEIINPSDPYTLQAEGLIEAVAASIFLGNGKYGLTAIDHDLGNGPLFLFGGIKEVEEWFQSHGTTWDAVRFEPEWLTKIAGVLESVLIGKNSERKIFDHTLTLIDDPDKKKEFIEKWHDDHRSSMNDIGGRAISMAAKLRESLINK